ncbi:hypothetical protein J7E38_18935 [Bacillus sp. ISL-35]|uniref:hypothetical protein n=1 Tax=Bacillus sp. ISL-35 TaxID=2819122 RepID=UPI001BE9E792|nr:hypothetical protein [Bacillus sp. ISL-35]MBT2681070.1 hypothetical protein [Bacillus sp. ISL-35]MBT2705390.1 hypothetical protein [Chryseobacterium sp. ISL-80]
MKTKLNGAQGLFSAFFIATILTLTSGIEWDNRFYHGFYAFIISLAVFFISKKIIKD